MTTDSATLRATQSVASIPRNDAGPVFREPWQAEAFALALALHERGELTVNLAGGGGPLLSGSQFNNKVFHNVPTDMAIPASLKSTFSANSIIPQYESYYHRVIHRDRKP